jgi:hypothetical protein
VRPPQIQGAIVAHLRAASHPVTSRDLAARFLLIRGPDEATCHRLLAPILAGVPGMQHDPASGWRFAPRAARPPAPAPDPPADTVLPGAEWNEAAGPQSLLDFVAVAVDGAGPGGSGAARALTYLPVVAGEVLQEENLPAWGLDSDGAVAGDAEDAAHGSNEPGRPGAAYALARADLEDLAEAVGDLPVVAHRAAREIEPLRRAAEAAGVAFHPRVLSAARFGHLLSGLKASHAAADLARALGVEAPGPDDCRGRARLVALAWLQLVPRLRERGIVTVDAALEFQDLPAAPLDLSGYGFSAEDLRALPAAPGVYRFLDRGGRVLYVGKARNLRARIASYFVPSALGTAKGRAILESVHRIAYDLVGSELEALLLEAALLHEHRPPLNRQFEVHERPAPYGPRRNLVVVLADAGSATCTLHLLRGGRYVGRLGGFVAPGQGAGGDVAALLDATYFAAPAAAAPADETIDIDWQLVASFLRRHRDAVNVLDIDECATAAQAVERVRVLGAAAIAGGRPVVAR